MAAVMAVMMLVLIAGTGHMGFTAQRHSDAHVTHSQATDAPKPQADTVRGDSAQGDDESR